MRPILLGIAGSFFFAFTFVLNRAMELSGGSWIWSASLRYFFMVPFLIVLVHFKGGLKPVFTELKKQPWHWLLWSTVGFGLFYAPLCFASAYGPGWLIAGTWQLTIISGSLLAPFFYVTIQTAAGPIQQRSKIPFKELTFSLLIFIGVVCMQIEHASQISLKNALLCIIPITIASFAYPLGNRKMMLLSKLNTYQRVLGMTIASLPFWIILSLFGLRTAGPPHLSQVTQASIVALFAGVCATVLFFTATDLVKDDVQKLGAVEATQSMAVLFTVIGEIIFLSGSIPSAMSWLGMIIIVVGMILHSYKTTKVKVKKVALSN
ncbi:multidrug resistance efflux transporter family protein [Priestia megaterium]|nr:multidrug resistance efflux transporter family protein [Priestia megaterium]